MAVALVACAAPTGQLVAGQPLARPPICRRRPLAAETFVGLPLAGAAVAVGVRAERQNSKATLPADSDQTVENKP